MDDLQARCERQALAVDRLTMALSGLRHEIAALRAENVELRTENSRLRSASPTEREPEPIELRVPLDVHAPAAARAFVGRCLRNRVASPVLEAVTLLASELVTNSVCHSGASAGEAGVVRVRHLSTSVRLEVDDPGHGGAVAPHAPDLQRGGGFGLHLVGLLSHRWGVEHTASRGTRVWAIVLCAPPRTPPAAA